MKRFALQFLYLLLALGCLTMLGLMIYQNMAVPTTLFAGCLYCRANCRAHVLVGRFFGALAGAFLLMIWVMQVGGRVLKATHQKEQAQVTAESQRDQVTALEQKIATLESALEKAMAGQQEPANS
ncbi:MAG: hypothetical protein R2857_05325 [Vampirovibrionales bacterium]